MSLLTKIWRTPTVTEPLARRDAETEVEIIGRQIDARVRTLFGRSVALIRQASKRLAPGPLAAPLDHLPAFEPAFGIERRQVVQRRGKWARSQSLARLP